MKMTIRKIVFVALLLGTLNSYATGTTLVENGNHVKVAFITVKKGQNVSIKNSKGKVLQKKTIETENSVDKAFDFNTLDNGYYTLEVNKDFQIEVIPFTVVSGNATFYKKEEKTIFKPVVRTEANSLLISKLEFDAVPLRVSIFYQGEEIFSETVQGGSLLQRAYKLEEKNKGYYKVVLKANDRTYSNEFSF
jgi:hypothetical protein